MWLLVLSGGLSVSAADDLGRLFFTPEERAALDAAARPPSLPPAAEVPAAAGLAPRVVPPATVTLDGVLSGPAGAAHVWVNGQGGCRPICPRSPVVARVCNRGRSSWTAASRGRWCTSSPVRLTVRCQAV